MNKKYILQVSILIMIFVIGGSILLANRTEAAIENWNKGISINPISAGDFNTGTFQESLRDAVDMGANSVTLIIPYYQSSLTSHDLVPGQDTPSDESLISAIKYAHSLNIKVDLKPHLQVWTSPGEWRANIKADDREAWYAAYSNMLKHYALIAENNSVEQITIGTELINMASAYANPDNTTRWRLIISDLRGIYSGKLTYSANWGTWNWYDEKKYIEFWDNLDSIGISAYLPLAPEGSYSNETLKSKWESWNNTDIKPLYEKFQKPIFFSEVGYRSMDGALVRPSNWQKNDAVDTQEQVDAYRALFDYWGQVPYFTGINIWEWSSDPNAGGPLDKGFTPQGKPAFDYIKYRFTGIAPNPTATPLPAPQNDIVLYAADVLAEDIHGNWQLINQPEAAGGFSLYNPDQGEPKTIAAAAPTNYVDIKFLAQADVQYHLWLRMKAHNDIYSNDSVYVQFLNTSEEYKIGTPNALTVILENGNGVGLSGWGWNDNKYEGLGLPVVFNKTGENTIRIQSREDGIMFDQIILSPKVHFSVPPGAYKNDSTIIPKSESTEPTPAPTPTPSPTTIPNSTVDIWWPTDGSNVSGLQPFKALVPDRGLGDYNMYWQVDGDRLNIMADSYVDWPHKEAWVELSGWNWNSEGRYLINFIAKNLLGNTIAERLVKINIL